MRYFRCHMCIKGLALTGTAGKFTKLYTGLLKVACFLAECAAQRANICHYLYSYKQKTLPDASVVPSQKVGLPHHDGMVVSVGQGFSYSTCS